MGRDSGPEMDVFLSSIDFFVGSELRTERMSMVSIKGDLIILNNSLLRGRIHKSSAVVVQSVRLCCKFCPANISD